MVMPIRKGRYYVVTEWDDSRNVVQVVAHQGQDVLMRYEDGLTHKVSRDYFRSVAEVYGDVSPAEFAACRPSIGFGYCN